MNPLGKLGKSNPRCKIGFRSAFHALHPSVHGLRQTRRHTQSPSPSPWNSVFGRGNNLPGCDGSFNRGERQSLQTRVLNKYIECLLCARLSTGYLIELEPVNWVGLVMEGFFSTSLVVYNVWFNEVDEWESEKSTKSAEKSKDYYHIFLEEFGKVKKSQKFD